EIVSISSRPLYCCKTPSTASGPRGWCPERSSPERTTMPDTEKHDDFAGLLDDHDEVGARESAVPGGRRDRRRSEQRRRVARRRGIVAVIVVIALIAAGTIGWAVFGDRISGMLGANDYTGTGNGTEVTFTV